MGPIAAQVREADPLHSVRFIVRQSSDKRGALCAGALFIGQDHALARVSITDFYFILFYFISCERCELHGRRHILFYFIVMVLKTVYSILDAGSCGIHAVAIVVRVCTSFF